MKYNVKIPHSRGLSKQIDVDISAQTVIPDAGSGISINDIVLHALIVRIAYDDGHTEEFLTAYNNGHIEIDIPQDRLDVLDEVVIGPKIRQYIDWLVRRNELTRKASKTQYGIVKIGTGIDVSDGVISVTGGIGESLIVTYVDYTVIDNPSIVVAKAACNITLPLEPVVGWRLSIKNGTDSSLVNIVGAIDGSNNPILYGREAFSLVYDGTDWNII